MATTAHARAVADEGKADAPHKRGHERSSIQFPYGDLNDAIEIAQTVHDIGGERAQVDQIAARLKHQNIASGAFRMKLNAGRTFGLITTDKTEVALTALGRSVNDPKQEAGARVTAFLTVPLYQRLHEKYRGGVLPADEGLENSMVELGVTSKQKDKARQTFQRSAAQAGMFTEGRNRLVIPPAVSHRTGPPPKDKVEDPIPPTTTLHPFVQGLLDTLPPLGTDWSLKARKKWLVTAENIFSVLYGDPGEDQA